MAEALFDKGLEILRAVLGPAYVDTSLTKADDFMMAFQRITTEWCWGYGRGEVTLEPKPAASSTSPY
jgi:4-carboxymuconolactone decarboxylase